VRVTDPDAYLCDVADELPNEVVVTVIRLAGEKRRRAKTAPNLLADLAAASVPAFASKARPLLEPNVS
jgi:hypothetical protein